MSDDTNERTEHGGFAINRKQDAPGAIEPGAFGGSQAVTVEPVKIEGAAKVETKAAVIATGTEGEAKPEGAGGDNE